MDRSLSLTWEEECRWVGVDPAEVDIEPLDVTTLFIELEPEDLEHLYSRSVWSDDRIVGRFKLSPDAEAHALDPGIRFRGHSSRRLPKKSFNVRFPGHVEGLDADRTNLNAMYTDPSQAREHLAMRMFRAADMPAPRTGYVDLYLNGIYEGLYVAVQRVDEWLLADHGLPTGGASLVRDRTRQVTGEFTSLFTQVEDLIDDREALVDRISELVQTRGDADLDALADLVVWTFSDGEAEARLQALEELIEIDSFVDWYALHELLGDIDSFGDDHWLYRPPGDEARWSLIPWDKDLSFGSHTVPGHGGVTNDVFHIQLDSADPVARLNPFMEQVFSFAPIQESLASRITEFSERFDLRWHCAQLAEAIPAISESAMSQPGEGSFHLHGANHHSEIDDHPLHVAALTDFVQLRRAFLKARAEGRGEPDTATVRISEDDVGSSVLFTDHDGWTLARIDVTSLDEAGEITVSIEPSSISPDVDRRWMIDAGDAHVGGHLSLYYQNSVAFEDWYTSTEEFEATAGQEDLKIVVIEGDQSYPLSSTVNPYSNRVAAQLDLSGRIELVLERRP